MSRADLYRASLKRAAGRSVMRNVMITGYDITVLGIGPSGSIDEIENVEIARRHSSARPGLWKRLLERIGWS